MDVTRWKLENSICTLLRIELLFIQSVLYTLGGFVLLLCCIPILPIAMFVIHTIKGAKTRTWKGWLSLPKLLFTEILVALIRPFLFVYQHVCALKEILAVEWQMRWAQGNYKKLDGTPTTIPSQSELYNREYEILKGVLEEYDDDYYDEVYEEAEEVMATPIDTVSTEASETTDSTDTPKASAP